MALMPCAYNTTHMDVGSNGSGESVVTVHKSGAYTTAPEYVSTSTFHGLGYRTHLDH